MMLAEKHMVRSGTGFAAYMTLQRALLARWIARGGTEVSWCARMAPLFRQRYGWLLVQELDVA
jgi:hypothetical protein